MRASIEELSVKADSIKTFLEWLNFALIDADRYTYDSKDTNNSDILEMWGMVIGCQTSTIESFLTGEHKVPGDFLWSLWSIWNSDIGGLGSVSALVLSAWNRVKNELSPNVCNIESSFRSNISPGLAIVAYRLKCLRFSIGGMMDFDGQIELIQKTIGEANTFTINKYRR